ncbi:ABC transporter substrate-binding protein [Nitrospinota bacterium]
MRNKWMAIFVVLAFGLMTPLPADAFKGKVTIALPQDPPTMDPHFDSNSIGTMNQDWAYDTLLKSEPGTGKFLPWLATKWKKLGHSKMKFWLRKGVKFTDGTPLTSKAVKATMERIMDRTVPSRQRLYWKAFDRIEVIDDYTFIWHSKVSDNGILNRVSRYGGVMNPKAMKWDRAKTARNTAGSGAYILKSWTKGHKMVFEANPTWWGNSLYPSRPKTVVQRRIREATTRVKSLLRGEVDLIMGVLPQFIPEVERNPNTKLVSIPAVRIHYFTIMTRHGGPFGDRKVRLAVNHAIDTELLRKTMMGGRADPIGQLFHPWCYSGHNPKKTWYGYDPEKAKKLLKESSYPKGFKATIIASSGRHPADKDVCVAGADMLKKIGIDATCNPMTYPLWSKTYKVYQRGKKKGNIMSFRAWGNPAGDSHLVLSATSTCKGTRSMHCIKELDEAIEKAAATAGVKEQQAAYEKVTNMQKEMGLFRPLYKIHDVYGFRKNIEFRPRHDETINPWDIVVK